MNRSYQLCCSSLIAGQKKKQICKWYQKAIYIWNLLHRFKKWRLCKRMRQIRLPAYGNAHLRQNRTYVHQFPQLNFSPKEVCPILHTDLRNRVKPDCVFVPPPLGRIHLCSKSCLPVYSTFVSTWPSKWICGQRELVAQFWLRYAYYTHMLSKHGKEIGRWWPTSKLFIWHESGKKSRIPTLQGYIRRIFAKAGTFKISHQS